jgi:hypothetical protein
MGSIWSFNCHSNPPSTPPISSYPNHTISNPPPHPTILLPLPINWTPTPSNLQRQFPPAFLSATNPISTHEFAAALPGDDIVDWFWLRGWEGGSECCEDGEEENGGWEFHSVFLIGLRLWLNFFWLFERDEMDSLLWFCSYE